MQLCFMGRRELRAYVGRVSSSRWATPCSTPGSSPTLGFARTDVLPVVPGFAHLDVPPNRSGVGPSLFDDDWTNIVFVGRVIPNKKFEDSLSASFTRYPKTRFNPRSRLLLVGSFAGFEKYLAMVQSRGGASGNARRALPGHVSNEELIAYYDVADLFLCAS